MRRNAALGELERRTYERGNNKVSKPDNIPVINE